MSSNKVQQPSEMPTTEQLLQQAIAHHQSGELMEAGTLYQTILASQPNHPAANHNLGLIAVQAQQPEAGLPYFEAALNADPTCKTYWLSYIDALLQTSQFDAARNILALARQHGLEGKEVTALAARLEEGIPIVDPSDGNSPSSKDMDKLLSLFHQGRYSEVVTLARRIIDCFPLHEFGWKSLGAALKQLGRNIEALETMKKAAALAPNDVESIFNLGVTLQELKRLEEAADCYRQALIIDPGYADAALNLGVALNNMGHLDEAEEYLRRALQIKPTSAAAHSNLGATLMDLGRLDEAVTSYRRSLEIAPNIATAHHNLGMTLQKLGHLQDAEASFRHALRIDSNDAKTHNNLAIVLQELGRLDEADAHFQLALQITPDNACTLSNRGNLLRNMGRLKEAELCYRRSLEFAPEDINTLSGLGTTLQDLGRLDQAEACYRRILELKPDSAGVISNLGQALLYVGRLDESEACFRQALQIKPDHALLHSNLLYFLTLSRRLDEKTVFLEHLRFGQRFESPLKTAWPKHTQARDPEKTLNIGFVSPDFYNHAVASFMEPVLTHLSGKPQLTLHAYYNNFINDSVTQRLQNHFQHWNSIANLSDDELAKKVYADGIDILIDLTGHTAKNRLLVFARKPAPVQASWIGYPGTTGLSSMDYFLADRYLLPPGQCDDQFIEKIVRLPANAPFQPCPASPPINPLPALTNHHMTFGSFNRPNKLSRSVIALWSRLLRALPDARMLLGGLPETGYCDSLIMWFEEEGISRKRLDIHPRTGMEEYLALYHQVDICLDTFPYNGGTTTHHALWMGVPTLTLSGQSMAGKVGSAILSRVGLQEFAVEHPDDFVARGLRWAGNLAALADLRAGLRDHLVRSPLRRPELLAAGLEHALRTMWRRWCSELPPESFEVSLDDLSIPTADMNP
jgi:predicted O-linked N-acetylglucosamine transferase (SPINDLY family)